MTTTPNTTLRCETCDTAEPHTGAHCNLSDGRILCASCWNAEVAARRAARKAELKASLPARKAAAAARAPRQISGGWSDACRIGLIGR